MRYVRVRLKEYAQTLAYRIYVTDSLKVITANTARAAGGAEMSRRYYEVIKATTAKPETRTAEEIIGAIKMKLSGGKDG